MMFDQRGDFSVGTNTALTGVLTLIVGPIVGLVQGNWGLVGGGLLAGGVLLGVGYLLLRAEEPPKSPPA